MAGKGIIIENGFAPQALAASQTTLSAGCTLEIIPSATKMLRSTRMRVSQFTHKTSEQYSIVLYRHTATGTGTAFTAMLKEPNSGATGITGAKINLAGAGSTATDSATIRLATANWNSLTGRDIIWPPGQEIYCAPSATTGHSVAVLTPASTTSMNPTVSWELDELG